MMLMKEAISVNAARGTTLVFLLLLAGTAVNGQGLMGGGGESVAGPCISEFERAEIARALADYVERFGPLSTRSAGVTPEKFTFYPMAGTLYRDLMTANFVDLDPSPGIQDWDCTEYTYDGHDATDVLIRTFGEQMIGVPIFSALDGTVISTHDGEDDMCTNCCGTGNHVIIDHGNGRICYYWHFKKNSVQVSVGLPVKAGEQLGLTGSSGCSTWPHIHFATYDSGVLVEPYTGPCRTGESEWTNQTALYRDTYLIDLNMSDVDLGSFPGPSDMPRTGTFLDGVQEVSFRVMLANHPAGSTWRIRYRRPDESIAVNINSNFGNPFYSFSWWWWSHNINLNQLGTWHLLFEVNGELLTEAPFDVVASRGGFVNRPPHPISVQIEPAMPTEDHVLICRVETDLVLDDPDYDIVQYEYTWTVGGQVERVFVGAAHSDVLPHHTAGPGELVECTVVPGDGTDSGPSASDSVTVCLRLGGTCGDGTVDSPCEICDDGNTAYCDGCRGDCSAFETGCGDGFLCGAEICDDGNTSDCDGCRGDCSARETGCGDGFVCGAEVCDNGNTSDCNGCRGDCSAVEGTCGDGTLDPVCETCDDGNTDDADGCSSICAVEDGCVCSGEPSMCLCRPVSPPPPHDILKNRYISIDPRGAGGANVGLNFDIKLTLTSSLVNGQQGSGPWWAGPPDAKCLSVVVQTQPGVPTNWDACPTLHLTGCPIIPTSDYDIVAVSGGTDSTPPLAAATQAKPGPAWHGDAVGSFDGQVWSGPNGVANISDVTATIKTFVDPGAFNAVHVSLVDVHPVFLGGPHNNRLVNINDVLVMIKGFQGDEYAEPDLTQCP